MKACPENRFNVNIGYYQVLFKLFALDDKFTFFVQYHAVAVKYQFILSTHQIVIDDDGQIVRGTRAEHYAPLITLAGMIR